MGTRHTESQLIPQLQISKSQQISTTSNDFISANSQPIWVKLRILHLMTNPNKVYNTTPNLNHFKSQLISTTCNPYISSQFSTDFVQTLDSTKYKKPHQTQLIIPPLPTIPC